MIPAAWRTAFKIAWRESRAAQGKFLFVILAVAAGVGAVSGVRGFAGAFRDMLLRDARQLMAADLAVRMYHEPDADEQAALDRLVNRGARRTWVTETVSMVSSPDSADVSRPLMVSVKAVDPAAYPFYGEIRLRGGGRLADLLDASTVGVSEDLLIRLGVEVGDSVRLGGVELTVGDVVLVEPDRMTGSFNVGPRLMLSREALDRTSLITRGSRAAQRFLYRLPEEGITVDQARRDLEQYFQGRWIADYRETHPTIRRGLERATNFLSLVSLVAMIVGAMGVAMAMHSHLQQRLDTIAIMKCIGARSSQILRIYLIQTLALGLAGSAVGLLAGYGVQAWAPRLIATYFPQAPDLAWNPVVAVQALAIGVLTTLLFALPPLLAVRKIRPALIFRRDLAKPAGGPLTRLREAAPSLGAGAVIVAGLGAIASWLGDSPRLGLWFAGGLVVSMAVLAGTAWSFLRALKKLPEWLPVRLPTALRHGLANLHRPGVHATTVLVALGVGVTFTLSVYLIQRSVLEQMAQSAPPDMPNLFLINVTEAERESLVTVVNKYTSGPDAIDLVPSVPARLTAIDGTPLDDVDLADESSRYRRTRGVTWFAEQPDEIDVVRGEWWDPGETRPLAGLREDAAETLGVDVGSKLTWIVGADTIETTVGMIYRVESIRPSSSTYYIFTPATLAGRQAVYYGGVRIAPDQAVELQREAYEKFPTVTVVSVADVLKIVQEVVDQIAIVVEFVSAFAIFGGVIILTSAVVATRFRRVRETAILKTLGATRAKVARIFSVEFLAMGLVAGLIGAALASAFSALLLREVLEADYRFDPWPNVAAVAATALLANAAGWLASFRILGRKPLEVLRGE